MQLLLKYKNIVVACVTIGLAFVLSVLPITGYSSGRLVPLQKDLLRNSALFSTRGLRLLSSSINGQGYYLSDTLDNADLDLIWTGAISISGQSSETIANVILAAGAVNMTTVNRFDTFSFNHAVGMRTPEKGYQDSLIYSNGSVVPGVGGGVCIVSTILYNAALEAGLKIIERHPHSGPVSYADPGRDAAVSFGYLDMRFKNDSEGPILIKTDVENDEIVVSLYGHQVRGRKVEISAKDFRELPYAIEEIEDAAVPDGQEIVDQKARPGYEVTIVRTFLQDGKPIKQEIVSHDVMPPQNKIVRVPYTPISIPADLPQLPGLPSMGPLMQTPIDSNETQTMGDDSKAVPVPKQPVSGTIKLPDETPKPKPDQNQDGKALPPAPSVSDPSAPSASGDDGRSLSTKDRTSSTESE